MLLFYANKFNLFTEKCLPIPYYIVLDSMGLLGLACDSTVLVGLFILSSKMVCCLNSDHHVGGVHGNVLAVSVASKVGLSAILVFKSSLQSELLH